MLPQMLEPSARIVDQLGILATITELHNTRQNARTSQFGAPVQLAQFGTLSGGVASFLLLARAFACRALAATVDPCAIALAACDGAELWHSITPSV